MDEDGYQSITKLEDIMGYIDSVDGFHDCSAGSITYDDNSGVLSVEIEEVLEGEDWPRESSGRIWFMNFADIQAMRLSIDVPLGFWISDTYTNDDGSVTIEGDQGTITVLANTIELVVPTENATEEGGESLLATKAENAPLNVKNIFNDIKNVVNQKREQLAPESSDPVAISESSNMAAAPASEAPQAANPFANATPAAANPFMNQQPAEPAQAVESAPIAPAAPMPNPAPVAPVTPAQTPAQTPAPAPTAPVAPQGSNPFLNDPSFVSMQPTTPTPPPKAPDPPMGGPIFS